MARLDSVGNSGVSAQQYQKFIDSHQTGVKSKKGFSFRSVFTTPGKALIKAGRNLLKSGGTQVSPLKSKNISALPKERVIPKMTRPESFHARAPQTSALPAQPPKSPASQPVKDDIEALLDGFELDDDMMDQLEQEVRAEGYKFPESRSKAATSKAAASSAPQERRKKAVDRDEPAALKQLRRENEQKSQSLAEKIANLPTPPTDMPKGPDRSTKRMMSPEDKALVLPSSFSGLSAHIRGITTTMELLETWNALTPMGMKGDITDSQLSQLKGHCVSKLEIISKNPVEADKITEADLKKLVPGFVERYKLSARIDMNRSSSVNLQSRLDELRKR